MDNSNYYFKKHKIQRYVPVTFGKRRCADDPRYTLPAKSEGLNLRATLKKENATHTTKYGNKYTREEWKELQEQFARERAENDEWLDGYERIFKTASKMLKAVGVDGNTYGIARRIYERGFDGISFTSSDKEKAVRETADWIKAEVRKLGL